MDAHDASAPDQRVSRDPLLRLSNAGVAPRRDPARAWTGALGGFIILLFITEVAVTGAALAAQAEVGILTASAVAAVVGRCCCSRPRLSTGARQPSLTNEDRPAR